MQLIHPQSLTATLEAVDQAVFFKTPLSQAIKAETAEWIARQQMPNGSLTGISPAPEDYLQDIRLFTGEKLTTRFAATEITGQEACRAMLLLAPANAEVRAALKQANQGLRHACFVNDCSQGECAHAAVSFGRYLAVGGFRDTDYWIEKLIPRIRAQRDGKGRWQGFPFYFTLLALTEIDHPAAKEELAYALPACKRLLNRSQPEDKYGQRRTEILRRVLLGISTALNVAQI